MPLVGVVTGKTKSFAFLDVGAYQRRGKFEIKNTIPGGLHRFVKEPLRAPLKLCRLLRLEARNILDDGHATIGQDVQTKPME